MTANFSANGDSPILSIAAGKSVYFFNGQLGTRELLKTIKTRHDIASVAVHAEKRQFVTGGSGDTWVRLWDYDEGKELGMFFSSFFSAPIKSSQLHICTLPPSHSNNVSVEDDLLTRGLFKQN